MSERPPLDCPVCEGDEDLCECELVVGAEERKLQPHRRRRSVEPDYEEAWSGATEDRSTYNLGNGCRRVPARRSYD